MFSTWNLILPFYYGILTVLALYGIHRAWLLALLARHPRPPTPVSALDDLPRVTVQLPLYNEMYVAPRLLDAVCAMNYPQELLDIQVLDDSNDETVGIVDAAVQKWRARGYRVRHLHRTERKGFKAGALAAGLESAEADLIAVFDADFVPPPDFLHRTLAPFRDPKVGMVQARWEHLNRKRSLLTRVQAILLDGHFLIEHSARFVSGRFFNFNGTAGIWRKRAILEAGGWQHDTLTEDLDLSYRAQLAGWRFVYLPEVAVPAELPVDIAALKTQQYRWAKGSIQTGRKLLGSILLSTEPWWKKLEASLHLTNNLSAVLMVALSLLIFPAMLVRQGAGQWKLLAIDLPLFLAATASVVVFFFASQRLSPTGEKSPLRLMPAVLALGIGLSLNSARAVIAGLLKKGGVFVRTPKYSVEGRDGALAPPLRYRSRLSSTFLLEGAFALYFAVCTSAAAVLGMWLAMPFLYLFFRGYFYVFLLSVGARQQRSVPVMAFDQEGLSPSGSLQLEPRP